MRIVDLKWMVIKMFKELTMEATFIVTGISVLLIGIGLGLLVYWISKKVNERNDDYDK